ncbi:MAG: hypothetical protein IPL53_16415 [Ignavibacteria bacterium]|nr:hypothetical protein [Ignavibacteria bacterium]
MKRVIFLFAFLILIGINLNVNAQLSGPKSIPGDFASISAAISALDTLGVGSGGVTFNVAAGHTETASNLVIAFTVNPATSANPVVFQKSGAGANPLITAAPGTSATLDGILKFSGADYITFDAIDLLDPVSNTGNAMMEWGHFLLRASATDGSQNNIIRNCAVTLQKINTNSIGIYIANENLAGVVVAADTVGGFTGGFNSNNMLYGNSISDIDIGIFAKSVTNIRDIGNAIGVTGFSPNNITNWGGSQLTAGLSHGIRCEGQSNLRIRNNIINGGAGTGGSSSVVGIMVTSSGTGTNLADYEISNNQVTVSTNPTSQGTWGIRALGTGDSVAIHHNIIENCVVFQNSTTFEALMHDPTGTTNFVNIHDNIIRNNSHSGTGFCTLLGCDGAVVFAHIYDNKVYGNQKTGASGTLICINTANGRTDCEFNEVYNNSMPNSSGTALCAVYGYRNSDLDPAVENIYNNMFYNLSIGGSNSSTTTIVAGMRTTSDALSTKDFRGNSIYGLSNITGNITGNTTGGGTIGIWNSTGTLTQIHRNKIFDLRNTGSNGTTIGCWVSGGTSNQVFNNVITDLKAANSGNANAVLGINVTNVSVNTSTGLYYNSIHLTAAGGVTFGSSGVFAAANATATTGALDMRFNNIVNISSPGTTSGNTVAFRRSSTPLNNYALTSDSNNFYAGSPALNMLIFFDGTNSDQTLGAYQARVAPRDANSTTNSSKSLSLTINLEACAETDTISVEIRKSLPPYNLLDSDKGLGGQGIQQGFGFEKPVDGVGYYIVVRHRNSIATWSKSGNDKFKDGALTYDFTTAASQAFGANEVLVGSDYSIYTGDVNQNGNVDLSDIIEVFNDSRAFVTGYVVTDLNCDDAATLEDVLFAYNNSAIFVEVRRP